MLKSILLSTGLGLIFLTKISPVDASIFPTRDLCTHGDKRYVNISLINHTNTYILGHNTEINVRGPIAGPHGARVNLSCMDDSILYDDKSVNYTFYVGSNISPNTEIAKAKTYINMTGNLNVSASVTSAERLPPSSYNIKGEVIKQSTNHYQVNYHIFSYPKPFTVRVFNYTPWNFSVKYPNFSMQGIIQPAPNPDNPTYTNVKPQISLLPTNPYSSYYKNTTTITKNGPKAIITNQLKPGGSKTALPSAPYYWNISDIQIYNTFSDLIVSAFPRYNIPNPFFPLYTQINLYSNDGKPYSMHFNVFNHVSLNNNFWLTQVNPIHNIQSVSLDQEHKDGIIYPNQFCNLYYPKCTLSWEITGNINGTSGHEIATIQAYVNIRATKVTSIPNNFDGSTYNPLNDDAIQYPKNKDGSRKYPYAVTTSVDANGSENINNNMDITLNPYPNTFYISIDNKINKSNLKIYSKNNAKNKIDLAAQSKTKFYPDRIPLVDKKTWNTYHDTYIIENTATGDTVEIPIIIQQDEPGNLSSWSITNMSSNSMITKTLDEHSFNITKTISSTNQLNIKITSSH